MQFFLFKREFIQFCFREVALSATMAFHCWAILSILLFVPIVGYLANLSKIALIMIH